MTVQRNVILGVVLVALAFVAMLLFYSAERSHRRQIEKASELAEIELTKDVSEETKTVQQLEIFLYRPGKSIDGDSLEQVSLEVPMSAGEEGLATQIINSVLQESAQILPPTARVLQVYLMQEGLAVVDLSRDAAEQLNGGVSTEYGILRSMTRSLRHNLPSIRQVRFLIDGEQRPTFSGHVSLSVPFM